MAWRLDVESPHPKIVKGFKGLIVHQLKWYVIWVQNDVNQFGPVRNAVFKGFKWKKARGSTYYLVELGLD